MKRKLIEKIPWQSTGEKETMSVVAKIHNICGEDILVIDFALDKPVVRIALSHNDFENYIPEESPCINVPRWGRMARASIFHTACTPTGKRWQTGKLRILSTSLCMGKMIISIQIGIATLIIYRVKFRSISINRPSSADVTGLIRKWRQCQNRQRDLRIGQCLLWKSMSCICCHSVKRNQQRQSVLHVRKNRNMAGGR